MLRLFTSIFVLLAFSTSQIIFAESDPILEKSNQETEKTFPDQVHRVLRTTVRDFADRIDRFFADERIEAERKHTSVRLRPTLEVDENGRLNFSLRFKANLVLPRLEQKFQVFALSLVDEENDIDQDQLDTLPNTPSNNIENERNAAFGLQYNPFAEIGRHLRFRIGAKLKDLHIIPFASVRYRYTYHFRKWLAIFKQRVFWFEDNGFGEQSDLEWERNIGDDVQFRLVSSVIWSEISEGLDLSQQVMLRRFLEKDKAISLSYRITGHTYPNGVVYAHIVALKYRQRLWREWLFFEIEPQLRYLREDEYKARPFYFVFFEAII